MTIAREVDAYPDWLFRCSSAKQLEKTSVGSQIVYLTFDVPWPGCDRILVLKVSAESAENGQPGTVRLESLADYYPAQNGFVRMAKVKRVFTFARQQNGKKQVMHHFFMSPGKNLRAAIVNSPDFTINTTDHLRSRVEQ